MFLQRLYKEWRLAFWLVLVFITAQVFFMAKAVETVPFFLYNMYSRDQRPVDSIPVTLIRTADGYLNHKELSGREEEMLMNPVGYYINLGRHGDGTASAVEKRFKGILPASLYTACYGRLVNDSSRMKAFPLWWRNYLSAVVDNRYEVVELVRSKVSAKAPYKKSPYDSLIFYAKPR
jgi:hypothetical protein